MSTKPTAVPFEGIEHMDIEDLFKPATYRRFARMTNRPELSSAEALVAGGDKKLFSNWLKDNGTANDFADVKVLLKCISERLGRLAR